MLSCKKATRLMSESQDRNLNLGERLNLGFHLALCRHCTRYERQLRFIRRASKALGGLPPGKS